MSVPMVGLWPVGGQPVRPRTTNTSVPKLAYSKHEAAAVLGIGLTTLHREIAAGHIRPVRCRNRVIIAASELQRFLNERAGAARQVS